MGRPAKESAWDSVHLGSDYTEDEVEFMKAMDLYKRLRLRPYPTLPEVLAVARSLGYRKIEEARQ